ncbi:MAG: hypothetical protein RIS35_1014 [Pseudomonadota bacterium]|jgi:RNA polymerase-associated protein
MILYSGTTCPFSHQCRIVLAEKALDCRIVDVDLHTPPPEVGTLNPYGQVPILKDRALVLYEATIINEYLDERYPQPKLMPEEPLHRGRIRLMIFNFERELFDQVRTIERIGSTKPQRAQAVRELGERLTFLSRLFAEWKFVTGSEFTLADVVLAPLLWRMPAYGIRLKEGEAALERYAERLFARPAFAQSLTPAERAMRR